MTFLPIVGRELQVAARRKSTYRTRTAMAVMTSVLAAGLLFLGEYASSRQAGGTVFPALSTLAFIYCLLVGARNAADSLSEEKREGTLGLLFLTDLRGYDVVLGKLVAVSARTFQGLLAFYPVLAIGLVLGGLTAGEFWRTTAVLTNALFLSLCIGLFVSALSRESHMALAGTVLLLGFWVLAPLGAGWLLSWAGPGNSEKWLSAVSPAAAMSFGSDLAYRADAARFWRALLLSHFLGWCFLFFASLALPRSWQERAVSTARFEREAERAPAAGAVNAEKRAALRRQLLDVNPILWLAARNERQRIFTGIFIGTAVLAGVVVLLLTSWLGGGSLTLFAVFNLTLTLALKLWFAWCACATMAEARRTGAVELLLATPLRVGEMIRGHWQALQRWFLWPVIAVLGLQMLPPLQAMIRQPPSGMDLIFMAPVPIATLFGMATLVLDLVAMAWVGMWMGLSQPKSMQAFARTILLVVILPALVFCLPNILFDLFWIQWARQKLEREFRRAAAERFLPVTQPAEWLGLPKPVAIPPVISR